MDLDQALREDLPISTEEIDKANEIKAWDRSDRMCLMIMKRSIPEAFRGSMIEDQSAKQFLTAIEQYFAKNEKSETSSLLEKLVSIKYKGKGNIREYIMEMSHIATKLRALKFALSDDMLVHFVLLSLPVHFGQFIVSYNTQKDKWSLNELISHCVQEEERQQRDKTKSAHLASSSQSKKKRPMVSAGPLSGQKKLKKQDDGLTCFFYKKVGHMKKECSKFAIWQQKKGMLLTMVCSEVNLASVPIDTWWVDSGATTHISMSMQGCLWSRSPSDDERFIFVSDGNRAAVQAVGTFRLQFRTGFILDLYETFIVPSFRRNLISISNLDKSGFSCSFGDNKVCLL
ncbi:hypothetical protein Dimus_039306 [Dionaea muscipula]